MDLQDTIRPELWTVLGASYSKGDYTGAIRDAISVVTATLRDKTGLDGDGQELVGKALGFGKSRPPLLAVNRLQTETERSIQTGLLETLKGLYSLIRNPRSHEKFQDDKRTADAVILFVDYLLGYLGESQQSFTPEGFLLLVIDDYFARDAEYVDGLVNKIPVRKLYDTLVILFRCKTWDKADNYSLVIKAILEKLDDRQTSDFFQVVSDDLQRATKEAEITLAIKVLPPELWPRMDKLPRIRIESALLGMLAGAWYFSDTGKTNSAASTWIRSIASQFLRKDKLREAVIKKLMSEDFDDHNFVANYLLDELPEVFEAEQDIRKCCRAIAGALRKGNLFLKNRVVLFLKQGPPQGWTNEMASAFSEFTDPENPELYTWDGSPLFGHFADKPNPMAKIDTDEIPF